MKKATITVLSGEIGNLDISGTVPKPHSQQRYKFQINSTESADLRIEASDMDQIARVTKSLHGKIITISRDLKSAIVKVESPKK